MHSGRAHPVAHRDRREGVDQQPRRVRFAPDLQICDDASLGESIRVSFLNRNDRERYPVTEARALVANGEAGWLCIWGEDAATSVFWPRLTRILGDNITKVLKTDRVMQPNGRIRYDVYVPAGEVETLTKAIKTGAREKGWRKWFVRRHIPYIDRVGRGVSAAVQQHRTQNNSRY